MKTCSKCKTFKEPSDFCNRQLGVYENKPELFKNFEVYLSKGDIMKK